MAWDTDYFRADEPLMGVPFNGETEERVDGGRQLKVNFIIQEVFSRFKNIFFSFRLVWNKISSNRQPLLIKSQL